MNSKHKDLLNIVEGFKSIMETLPQKIFFKDTNSKFIACNKNYADALGIDKADIYGKDDYYFFETEIADFYQKHDLEVIVEDISKQEIEKQTFDGTQKWIQVNKSPIKNSSGEIIGLIGIFWDVTDFKAKEAYLTTIIERSPIVTILWQNKEHWPVEFISSNIVNLTGYNAEEFLNNSILYTQIIHPDDIQLVTDEVRINSENGNKSYTHTPYRIISKNGDSKWIKDLTFIRRDKNGQITHKEGIIIDISDLKLAEDKLTEYFHAVESSPSSITITDNKGVVEYANPKFTEVTGFSKEEAIGSNMNIISSDVHQKNFYIELWDTILSGREWRGTFCNKKKNGEIFWEKASISSIKDDNNNIIRFIGLKEDITKEREIEEREKLRLQQQLKHRTVLLKLSQMSFESIDTGLKTITESVAEYLKAIQVSIWNFTDNETTLECVNLYSESGHSKGEKLEKPTHPVFFEIISSSIFIIAEEAVDNTIFNQLVKEGYILPGVVSVIIFPIFIMGHQIGFLGIQRVENKRNWTDEDHVFVASIASIVSTLFETFERIEAEKKLIIAVKDAKKANRIKSDFLSNMSHEIRTPMNAILGFSQILLGRIDKEEERGFIESINSSGKHLLSLINDILDLSKVEAGKTDIVYKYCNFSALINNLEKMFIHKLIEKNINFDINLDPDIPENLLLDEERLSQVLINLVGNSIKFTKTGSVILSSYPDSSNTNKKFISLIIDINDTGIGIPEDDWEIVFNPLYQTSEGAKAEYSGTGLGLAISRKLIELMNGNLRIVPKKGPGTLFRVTLYSVKINESDTESDIKTISELEIPKTNTVKELNGKINISKINTIQVLQVLKNKHTKTCNILINKLSMQQAKCFAEEINNLGNKYKLPIIVNWAKSLSRAVSSFEKNSIMKSLNTFSELIIKIEELNVLENNG